MGRRLCLVHYWGGLERADGSPDTAPEPPPPTDMYFGRAQEVLTRRARIKQQTLTARRQWEQPRPGRSHCPTQTGVSSSQRARVSVPKPLPVPHWC